jgi:hypothetical protein
MWRNLDLAELGRRRLLSSLSWGTLGGFCLELAIMPQAGNGFLVQGLVVMLIASLSVGIRCSGAVTGIGAAGLWASVRCKNSWRVLLATMLAGYVGGLAIYLCTTPVLVLMTFLVGLVLAALDRQLGTQFRVVAFSVDLRVLTVVGCLGLALLFWLMSRLFLSQAFRWVADRERTRHWFEEPVYRRSRRRSAAGVNR